MYIFKTNDIVCIIEQCVLYLVMPLEDAAVSTGLRARNRVLWSHPTFLVYGLFKDHCRISLSNTLVCPGHVPFC